MFHKLFPLRSLIATKNHQHPIKIMSCFFLHRNQPSRKISQAAEANPAQKNFVNVLKHYGFRETDCLNIISADPQVLTIEPSELENSLATWSTTKLGYDYVNLLILNNPLFLYASTALVEKRLPLLQVFVKKPKDLLLLLLKCPNVLTEQWEQVQAKIDYLKNEMRVEQEEILQSEALNKTLDHIKLRHNLLMKCGMYQTPSQYEHKRTKAEKSALRNPHLKRIVDNEDISFSRKICKISLEEYEAYCEVFADEMEELEKEEYLSDSDDEE